MTHINKWPRCEIGRQSFKNKYDKHVKEFSSKVDSMCEYVGDFGGEKENYFLKRINGNARTKNSSIKNEESI